MSIQRLQRVTLAGLIQDKTSLLEQLQTLGCIHLIPLRPPSRTPENDPPSHAVETQAALRYLNDVPEKRRQVKETSGFDLKATVEAILANKQRLRDVTDLRDALQERLNILEPWGDFTLPPESDLAGQRLWFYCVPRRQMKLLNGLELPWQEVHRDNRQAWIVVIDPEEPPNDALPTKREHLGAQSLSEVRRRLDAAEIELEDVLAERYALTRYTYLISLHLARAEDAAQLRHAEAQTLDPEALFLVQGWIPVSAVPAVEQLASTERLALLLEEPKAEDAPPTLLDNPKPVAAGENLVAFYQMPAYNTWDPSQVVFFSFAMFFAMILSDAGYASLLALLLIGYWAKLGQTDLGQRLRVLGATLVTTSIAWGVLVGGYFGISPDPDTVLGQLHILDISNLETMMRVSIGVGVLHLVIANLQMVSVHHGRAPARVALGWIGVILGSFILWLMGDTSALPAWLRVIPLAAIAAGFIAILVLGSDRAVTDVKTFILRAIDGLSHLLQITKAFGDIMSYLRLFALGLASASLAITFNGLAHDVASTTPGIGLLLSILILLIGHALNLTLTIVSGVVHGLRLNYIEFYNWALSGEGYPFKPFKKTELRG